MQEGNNPYQAPGASLAEQDPLRGQTLFTVPGRRVPSGNGGSWIREGWRLFTVAPLLWIVAAIIVFVLNIAVSFIPFIGSLAQILFGPSLMVGVVAFARAIDKDEGADINHLFDGFRERLSPLVVVGLLYFAMIIGIAIICGILAAVLLSSSGLFEHLSSNPNQLAQALAQSGGAALNFLLIVLIFAALLLPVVAAYWFAPALVFFAGLEPIEAMKASFSACFQNFVPFLVYSLVLLLLAIVAVIPFGLGFIVLVPVAMASLYTSFKDIFGSTA